MEYTVEVIIATDKPLTEDQLFDAVQFGGVGAGDVGWQRLETILQEEGATMGEAADRAVARILRIVPGRPVAVEVMTFAEQDRRNAESKPVGVAELADLLGVSRQRASTITGRADFPAPAGELRSGPFWRLGDVKRFIDNWDRKPGRPKREVA